MKCIDNNNMDNVRNSSKSGRGINICIFCFLSVFFVGMLALRGVPTYSDSEQYISMHVHREPVYPLFLWVTRLIAGDNSLLLAGIVQSVLAIYASYKFVMYLMTDVCSAYVKGNTITRWIIAVILTLTVLVPYIITPLMSVTHVMLSSGILSEALAMPLFLLYLIRVHKLVIDRTDNGDVKYAHIATGYVLAFVLSLTRSQMIVTLIMWVILSIISVLYHDDNIIKNDNIEGDNSKPVFQSKETDKRKSKRINGLRKIALLLVIFAVSFPFRMTLTKTYNYIFNGRYVDNVYTNLTVLSNVFYATDRESGELIEDEELRNFFYRLYDVMDENEWSYKYAGDTAIDRAVYLEEVHDRVKFDVLEAGFRDILNEQGMDDYIDYNYKAEEYCAKLLEILRPKCLIRWIVNWMIMGLRGIVRSIAVCKSIMYIYTFMIILYTAGGVVICFKKTKTRHIVSGRIADDRLYISPSIFAIISLLFLFGNALGTAFTIMCLSRYMIYAFAPFYTSVIAITLGMVSACKNSGNGVVTP